MQLEPMKNVFHIAFSLWILLASCISTQFVENQKGSSLSHQNCISTVFSCESHHCIILLRRRANRMEYMYEKCVYVCYSSKSSLAYLLVPFVPPSYWHKGNDYDHLMNVSIVSLQNSSHVVEYVKSGNCFPCSLSFFSSKKKLACITY